MRAFFIYLKLILVKFCLDTSYAAAAGLLFRDNKLSEVARVGGMRTAAHFHRNVADCINFYNFAVLVAE